jgi:hypothetical protein
MLRSICGFESVEAATRRKNLLNANVHNLCSSLNLKLLA